MGQPGGTGGIGSGHRKLPEVDLENICSSGSRKWGTCPGVEGRQADLGGKGNSGRGTHSGIGEGGSLDLGFAIGVDYFEDVAVGLLEEEALKGGFPDRVNKFCAVGKEALLESGECTEWIVEGEVTSEFGFKR